MAFPDIQSAKRTAAQHVAEAPNARRLILIHAGIPLALALVLTFLNYLLSRQIADTGGLGGLGMRSVLETLQSMLQIVSSVFSIFWASGYVRVLLLWTRGKRTYDGDLLEGFRRWGAVLRSALLQAVIYLAVSILAIQISSFVFAATPLAKGMTQLVEQMLQDPSYMPTDAQLLDAVRPYLPFLLVTLAVFVLPVAYRLRLMDFALMDAPEKGAFHALQMSLFATRRNCLKLVKLDFSFWWYYLLELVIGLVYYGDVLLELMGVDVGLSSEVLLFAACIIGLLLQLGLYVWRRNQVMTTYALVYENLKYVPEPERPQEPDNL